MDILPFLIIILDREILLLVLTQTVAIYTGVTCFSWIRFSRYYIYGDKNVALGAYSLHGTRRGDFNIAIGHGAGYYIGSGDHYKFYLGAHNVSGDAGCDLTLYGSGTPLMYGELDTLRLGIGVNSLHDYGSLQVSGGVALALD